MDNETVNTNEGGQCKKRIKIFYVLVILTLVFMGCSTWRIGLSMNNLPTVNRTLYQENKHTMLFPKIIVKLSNRHRKSPKRLCFRFMGRLGNRMFQFASLIGIARSKGMTPVLQKTDGLVKMFELTGISTLDYNICRRLKVHRDKRSCAYDHVSVDFSGNKDLGLFGFFQSWRYFKDSFIEVRKLFNFKPNLRDMARENLKEFIFDQHGDVYKDTLVLVGVHIRRRDIASPGRNKQHGYIVASLDYLHTAMNYFRKRFHRLLFVVCSDDEMWPFLNLPHNDSVFITGQSAELDMTTLVLCNHTVMTTGSFGWWSSWLTNGITLYPRQQYRPGSPLARQFNLTDYIPPHWIPIP